MLRFPPNLSNIYYWAKPWTGREE